MNTETDFKKNAIEYFEGPCNCAQAVLKALAPLVGMEETCAEALTAGFGGGVGGQQELCGAVSGACMAISYGLFHLEEAKSEGKKLATEGVAEFMKTFLKDWGAVRCFELTGHDFSKKEQRKAFLDKGLKKKVCFQAVHFAVEEGEKIILKFENLNREKWCIE